MMLMLIQMASHDQSHVAPNFNFLDLGNSMLPLMMPSASHDPMPMVPYGQKVTLHPILAVLT